MPAETSKQPNILLVSIDGNTVMDGMYPQLLKRLDMLSVLDRVTNPSSAIKLLADPAPHAVLVTDGGIAHHHDVYAKLVEYARSGGILIFMGNFSSYTRPRDLNKLLQEAGLPWKVGNYQRTTVHRNDTQETLAAHKLLPASYSQKAVFLSGVQQEDAWYLPNASSKIESRVFASESVGDTSQTPVAFTNIGKGKLGYVGDANGEEGSDAVVLAMCGLRDDE